MGFPFNADLDIIVEVYLGANPTDFPDDWPAPTNFSDRLLRQPIQIRRGRGQNQKTASAGACALWLDNTDGALTPLLATSVYYPEWDLGAPIRVSVTDVGTTPPYVRHAGFVADIEAVMVPGTGGKNISAVRVTSAGALRRLSQGAVVKSTLRRMISNSEPTAYWPFEDGSGATQAASAVEGVSPLFGSPVPDFGEADVASGSAGAVQLTTDGVLRGTVPTEDFVNEWRVEWIGRLQDGGSNPSTDFIALRWDCGLNWFWWRIFDDAVWIQGEDSTGGNLSLAYTADVYDGVWRHYRMDAVRNGTEYTGTFWVDGEVVDTGLSNLAPTLTGVASVEIAPNSVGVPVSDPDELPAIAHLVIWQPLENVDSPGATDGFAGEQAHERVERLCREEGINYSGTASSSNECGPQPIDDVIGVLQDAETIDHGMLIEDFAWGLDYRASSQRINLAPVLTVDLATYRTTSGTQADVLTPIRNDARMHNEWTITRPDGSSAIASDAAHKEKHGRYNDSATVNVEDDSRLLDEAQWRVHEGTFEGLRYQTIPLDLAANLDD